MYVAADGNALLYADSVALTAIATNSDYSTYMVTSTVNVLVFAATSSNHGSSNMSEIRAGVLLEVTNGRQMAVSDTTWQCATLTTSK